MLDGRIDLVDGGLELAARGLVVLPELVLEVLHGLFEVRDVDVLLTHLGQLATRLDAVERGVAQDRDHGNEELRTNDVHLVEGVAHVHDARVVELAFRLEHGDEHRVLAVLVVAVLVELLEEVLVFVVTGGGLLLGLHLEHDGEHLGAALVDLAIDEVALRTAHHLVVLVEVGVAEGRGTPAVELVFAVLLKRLADELGGKTNALVAQAGDLVLLIAELLVFVGNLLGEAGVEYLFCLLAFALRLTKLALDLHHALLRRGRRLGNGQLALGLGLLALGRELLLEGRDLGRTLGLSQLTLCLGLLALGSKLLLEDRQLRCVFGLGLLSENRELLLKLRNLRVTLSQGLLPLGTGTHLGRLDGAATLGAHELLALLEVVCELGIANLLDDLRVTALVHREDLAAMRAPNLAQGVSFLLFLFPSRIPRNGFEKNEQRMPNARTCLLGKAAKRID